MELQAPTTEATAKNIQNPLTDSNNVESFSSALDDLDSSCSTPYVSAPSSPGRGGSGGGGGFFYSAPASPMHFAMHSIISRQSSSESNASFDFEFSARFGSSGSGPAGSMSSADELFLNGQIRPMKLSSHLERPQVLAPLLDLEEDGDEAERGRDSRVRDRSLRRRARSMSPLRHAPPQRLVGDEESTENKNGPDENEDAATPSASASSSRSSSAGRSSKRWVFLKEFLRSKSEGRSNNKFWATISFSPAGKEKKPPTNPNLAPSAPPPEQTQKPKPLKKPANGLGKRRVPLSAHELHYTTKRAQAEELRKKTYLPYRQGLLGCLGFSSKGYGAMNGFARALNPVSSR